MAPRARPYGTTARHCAARSCPSRGRTNTSNTSADSPMRRLVVPAAPSTGNKPLAMAAPPCTLTMESSTAGTAGREKREESDIKRK